MRPLLKCRESGFVQSRTSQNHRGLVLVRSPSMPRRAVEKAKPFAPAVERGEFQRAKPAQRIFRHSETESTLLVADI